MNRSDNDERVLTSMNHCVLSKYASNNSSRMCFSGRSTLIISLIGIRSGFGQTHTTSGAQGRA